MYKNICAFGVSLFFITGAGCSIGRPVPETTEHRLELTPAVQSQFTAEAEWWRAYNDEQLNALVATALSRNLDLAIAAINVNRALYTARRIGADQLPEFSTSGSAEARRDLSTSDPSSRTVSVEGGVSYELDLWRRLADAASAKDWEYHATVEDKEAARLLLVTSTTDLYFELKYLDSAIAATRITVNNHKKLHQLITNRYQHGKVAALEPRQASLALLTEEKRLNGLEIRQKEVEQALRLLLNYTPGEPLGPNFSQWLRYAPQNVNVSVPVAVLARRPDLKAAEYRLQSAFKNLQAAQKAWYPTISLSAALGSSAETVGTMFDVPFTSGSVRINLPFLQWNTVKWNVKISEAEYDLVKVDFEKKINIALNEVALAFSHHANAEKNLINAEQRYTDAKKISDIYRLQYDHGKRELSDWLEALNTASTAWLEVLENRYQALYRANAVYKSMAGRYRKVGR